MQKKIFTILSYMLVAFICFRVFVYEGPSFPTVTEVAVLDFLNKNCIVEDLGLDKEITSWKLTNAAPTKKIPNWEKEPIYSCKVKLKGWYLPIGKTAKKDYEKFKTTLIVSIDSTNPQTPIVTRDN